MVYVVAGNGPNLMGQDWLCSLRVSIDEIHSMETLSNKPEIPIKLSAILQKHLVFTEGLGTFRGKSHITCRPIGKA